MKKPQNPKSPIRAPLLLLVSALAPACSYVPPDPPADGLDAAAFVVERQPRGEDDVLCVLRLGHDGTLVDGVGAGGLVCNEEKLGFDADLGGFAALVPPDPPDETYRFTYVRESVPTTLEVPIAERLRVPGLEGGAELPRSAEFTLEVTAAPGGLLEIVATGPEGGRAAASVEGGEVGPVALDTSALAAGPGTLRVSRRVEDRVLDTGFRSARWDYLQVREVDVFWR